MCVRACVRVCVCVNGNLKTQREIVESILDVTDFYAHVQYKCVQP